MLRASDDKVVGATYTDFMQNNNPPRPIEAGCPERAHVGPCRDKGPVPHDLHQSADVLNISDDELLPVGGPMPRWACLLTPFFNLLAYLLEKTIYGNVQLSKFGTSVDQDDVDRGKR